MSAAPEAIGQPRRRPRRVIRRSPHRRLRGGLSPREGSGWPLLTMLGPLIVYVVGVVACALALIGWEAAHTPLRAGQVALFAALLAAAVVCVEAMRRLGQPSGLSRDLLSAWWLPIVLLLPPLYSLLAPFVIGSVLYLRGRRIPVYRRVFSSAALGLAGAAASATFPLAVPQGLRLSLAGSHAWLVRPEVIGAAVACAVLFAVLNAGIVAVAAHLANPEAPLAKVLWDRESLLLDLTETCVGILVAVTCGLSFLLLLVALPPVILLQRSLMHQQLAAAARTDPKTGLLNA